MLFLIHVLSRLGRFQSAALWLDLIDHATTDSYRQKRSILLTSAYTNSYLERHSEAESAVGRAEAVRIGWDQWFELRKQRSAAGQWDLFMAKGYVAYAARRFHDALASYHTALGLAHELGQDKQLATLNNLAAAATDVGDLTTAEQYVEHADRLGGRGRWSGQAQFLRTTTHLRIAQALYADARAIIDLMMALGAPTSAARVLAAEVALGEGSTKEALQHLTDLTPQLLDPFSRDHAATLLERLGRIESQNESDETASEMFSRAAAFRLGPPAQTMTGEDPLLEETRNVLGRRKFGSLDPARALLLAVWLYFTFGLLASVLFPWDPPLPVVITQACLVVVWQLTVRPVNRLVIGPRRVERRSA